MKTASKWQKSHKNNQIVPPAVRQENIHRIYAAASLYTQKLRRPFLQFFLYSGNISEDLISPETRRAQPQLCDVPSVFHFKNV